MSTDDLADNSVTTGKISDGTIVNADVNSSAAIDGTKVSPNSETTTYVWTKI